MSELKFEDRNSLLPTVKLNEEGEIFDGVYLRTDTIDLPKSLNAEASTLHVFATIDKPEGVGMWAPSALVNLPKKVNVNELVRITFKGFQRNEKGVQYRAFGIEAAPGMWRVENGQYVNAQSNLA